MTYYVISTYFLRLYLTPLNTVKNAKPTNTQNVGHLNRGIIPFIHIHRIHMVTYVDISINQANKGFLAWRATERRQNLFCILILQLHALAVFWGVGGNAKIVAEFLDKGQRGFRLAVGGVNFFKSV